MKVYVIYSAFRESYEQSCVQDVYLDEKKADAALKAWVDENQSNCEEARFLSDHEVIE